MGGFRLSGPHCTVLQWYADQSDEGTLHVGPTPRPGLLLDHQLELRVPDLRLPDGPLVLPRPNFFDFQLDLPAPDPAAHNDASDDDDVHLAFDLASGVSANYPAGRSPNTYSVSLVLRNWNLKTFGGDDDFASLDLLHEPNISFQLSPDPDNALVYSAAISLVNLHLRLHGHELETSIAAQVQRTVDGVTSFVAQSQLELHITSNFSLTVSSSITGAPPSNSPDRGSVPIGSAGVWSWQPFNVGALVHFP